MITLNELYDYKRKVERELVMAEAKMSVIDDLIAEEEKKPTIETQEVYGFDEEHAVTETVETETQNTY
jgi:hypothetical protein